GDVPFTPPQEHPGAGPWRSRANMQGRHEYNYSALRVNVVRKARQGRTQRCIGTLVYPAGTSKRWGGGGPKATRSKALSQLPSTLASFMDTATSEAPHW